MLKAPNAQTQISKQAPPARLRANASCSLLTGPPLPLTLTLPIPVPLPPAAALATPAPSKPPVANPSSARSVLVVEMASCCWPLFQLRRAPSRRQGASNRSKEFAQLLLLLPLSVAAVAALLVVWLLLCWWRRVVSSWKWLRTLGLGFKPVTFECVVLGFLS